MLEDVITRRKIEAMSYEEYLRHVVEMAQAILHPEQADEYPEDIRSSSGRRSIFDHLGRNRDLALAIDHALVISVSPGWHNNYQMQNAVKAAIYQALISAGYTSADAQRETEELFDIAKRQVEYDQ